MTTPQWLKPEIVENQDGKFIVLPNDTLGQHLKRGERWEVHYRNILPLLLPEGSYAADVGAYIGYNTVAMARAVGPNGRVIAFEPLRIIFQFLCGNVALNGLTNVYPVNAALGHAENAVVSMVPVDYFEQNVNIMNTCVGVGGDIVTMQKLDSYDMRGLALIKVDAQGCERYILEGAAQTIDRERPFILIEVEEPQLKIQNSSAQDVLALLVLHRYMLIRLVDRYLCDYVAVPVEKREIIPQIRSQLGITSQLYGFENGSLKELV